MVGQKAELQLIATTHSPLVMASIEPLFDDQKDAWWDMDLARGRVLMQARPFERRGDAQRWLTSEAFDLTSTRSIEAETLLKKASALLEADAPDLQKIQAMGQKLGRTLPLTDDFLLNWRFVCRQKGWLK